MCNYINWYLMERLGIQIHTVKLSKYLNNGSKVHIITLSICKKGSSCKAGEILPNQTENKKNTEGFSQEKTDWLPTVI